MLAKTTHASSLTEADTRPITIASLVWRLWASAVARQMLRSWIKTFPPGVYGAMPGLSVEDACMPLQIAIEQSHDSGDPVSGLSMDLRKCFNSLARIPSKILLRKLGLPEQILTTWFNSLIKFTRMIQIGDSLSDAITSTTGVPEGCPLSVAVITAFAWAAAATMRRQGVTPLTYYDDWGWHTADFYQNQSTLHAMINFCTLAKLSINFEKSWAWSTNGPQRTKWKSILDEELPHGTRMPILNESVELGIVFRYAKTHGLGSAGQRIVNSGHRLDRIHGINTSIDVVAQLIQTVVWPLAFFGSPFTPLGYHHFEELRTKCTRVLLHQPESNASPWLTTNVLSARLQDPEELVHVMIWRNLKRYLYKTPTAQQNQFILAITMHSGDYTKIHGPAGVAKRSANRLKWTILDTGHAITSDGVKLHIPTVPWRRLCQCLHASWMEVVTAQIQHRKECAGIATISRLATSKALGSVESSLQRTAALQIVGGYASQARKAGWNRGISARCELCDEIACFRHSLFECTAMQDAYLSHDRAAIELEDHNRIWRIPVALNRPSATLLKFTSEHIHEGVSSEANLRLLRSTPHTPHIFIDGSGYHQTSRAARSSGWAIVLSTATLHERAGLAREYKSTRVIPPAFKVIAMAQTKGDQTVTRAELQALVVALEARPDSVIFTDCQSNLNLWNLVAIRGPDAFYMDKANEDLVYRLAKIPRPPQQMIHKVKSHVDSLGVQDHVQAFIHLGNEIADAAAKQAIGTIPTPLRQEAVQLFQAEKNDQSTLGKVLTYAARTTITYLKRVAESETQKGTRSTSNQKFQIMQNWNPPCTRYTVIIPQELKEACMWGTAFCESIQAWLQQLQWPTHSTPEDPGIAWLELCVNWQICSGMEIPRVMKPSKDELAKLPKDTYAMRTSQQDPARPLGLALIKNGHWTCFQTKSALMKWPALKKGLRPS